MSDLELMQKYELSRQQFLLWKFFATTGHTQQQIADLMKIQLKTVKYYATTLYIKLDVKSRPASMLKWAKETQRGTSGEKLRDSLKRDSSIPA